MAIVVFSVVPILASVGDARADELPRPEASGALAGLSSADAVRFEIGAAIFASVWVPAPDVSDGADGLGPLYNAVSCAQCHPARTLPTSAAAASGRATVVVRSVLRLGPGGLSNRGDPRYGRQLQDHAVPGLAAEGHVQVGWAQSTITLADGVSVSVRRPEVTIDALALGPLEDDTRLSLRRPPPLVGLGLIAAISEQDIEVAADPEDRDGDGIQGRISRAIDPENGAMRVARFGWKASVATLAAQTADALWLDMGLSSRFADDPAGDCTLAQTECRSAPDGRSAAKAGQEVSSEEIALLVAYLGGLKAPSPPAGGAMTPSGQRQFEALGCAGCHRERFVTREMADAPHLSSKVIAPFSDFLLHDMGVDLAVPGDEASLDGRSWRTTPLWGLGQRLDDIAQGLIDGLMHDGRARTIEEAILWHGGEGGAAREAYRNLPAAARQDLVAYLAGL